MKTHCILHTLALLFLSARIFSQEPELSTLKKNNLYIELLGSAGMYSIQYERILPTPVRWTQFAAGAGVSVYNNTTMDIPAHLSLLLGNGSSRLELGMGVQPEMYVYSEGSSDLQLSTFNRIGYRYQRRQGGFHFQCGATPIRCRKINWKSNWIGLGFGWTF